MTKIVEHRINPTHADESHLPVGRPNRAEAIFSLYTEPGDFTSDNENDYDEIETKFFKDLAQDLKTHDPKKKPSSANLEKHLNNRMTAYISEMPLNVNGERRNCNGPRLYLPLNDYYWCYDIDTRKWTAVGDV